MAWVDRRRWMLIFALLLVGGACTPGSLQLGDEVASESGSGSTGTSAPSTSAGTSTGTGTSTGASGTSSGGDPETSESETAAGWPACEPWAIQVFDFAVGPNDLSGGSDEKWPNGHHSATCEVVSLTAKDEMASGKAWVTNTLTLKACVDGEGAPAAHSLDLGLRAAAPLATALVPGQAVKVHFSTQVWQAFAYEYWYSIRDAETDELLLAAFADPGPTVVPKVPDLPSPEGWLAPFEAALGDFACPVDVGPFCEGDASPQRALVRFSRGDEIVDVVGGTVGDLGDYLVHLGFAGTPDACEGIWQSRPIHGVLVKKP